MVNIAKEDYGMKHAFKSNLFMVNLGK